MNRFIPLFFTYISPRLGVDIMVFFLALMFLSLLSTGLRFNLDFILGMVANYLLLVWAFIYNDIEDRADDANSVYVPQTVADNLKMVLGGHVEGRAEGSKRFLNPFSTGDVSVYEGYLVLIIIAAVALLLSWSVGGPIVLLIALSNLLIGWLYSYRKIRLKSQKYWDLISHAYLLGAAQIIFFIFFPAARDQAWGLIVAFLVFINSVSGDLRNEYRDFAEDRAHGVRNTATILGPERTLQISTTANAISIGMLVIICGYLILHRIGLF